MLGYSDSLVLIAARRSAILMALLEVVSAMPLLVALKLSLHSDKRLRMPARLAFLGLKLAYLMELVLLLELRLKLFLALWRGFLAKLDSVLL